MMISLIVAVTNNGVIGREKGMPWHLPADLAYFRRVTSGHPIIMGRKTHESIGCALPNRTNVVITRQADYAGMGEIILASSLECAIELAVSDDKNNEEIFIIGGGQVFSEGLKFTNRVYMNRIDTEIKGDTFFEKLGEEWQVVSSEHRESDEQNAYALDFLIYEKQ